MSRRPRICVALTAVLAVGVLPPAAEGAFPGHNGKIAWSAQECSVEFEVCTSFEIYSINPNGSGRARLTNNTSSDTAPVWSPDGAKIAFASDRDGNQEIYVMNADGSAQGRLTVNPAAEGRPAWSPHGSKIAFVSNRDGNFEIYTMNADGTNQSRITNDPAVERNPRWSPDGLSIAFDSSRSPSGVYVSNADGTSPTFVTAGFDAEWFPYGERIAFNRSGVGDFNCGFFAFTNVLTVRRDGTDEANLTNSACIALHEAPAWSPDGTAFTARGACDESADFSCDRGDIYIYPAGGSELGFNVTDDNNADPFGRDFAPDWQPIPINSYPRPKGATPTQVSLVPAYNQCTAPDRTHGPPLGFPSCSSPAQASEELTVGTGDSNGKPTKGYGYMRYDVIPGNPGSPADEADVGITVDMRDVYRQGTLADYTGELRARTALRITDKLNTPHPGGPGAATVSDASLGATVPCSATADTTEGAHCSLVTTMDALVPGTITETKRSIWALGAAQVDDGGADGDGDTPGDNTPFLTQGLFIP